MLDPRDRLVSLSRGVARAHPPPPDVPSRVRRPRSPVLRAPPSDRGRSPQKPRRAVAPERDHRWRKRLVEKISARDAAARGLRRPEPGHIQRSGSAFWQSADSRTIRSKPRLRHLGTGGSSRLSAAPHCPQDVAALRRRLAHSHKTRCEPDTAIPRWRVSSP